MGRSITLTTAGSPDVILNFNKLPDIARAYPRYFKCELPMPVNLFVSANDFDQRTTTPSRVYRLPVEAAIELRDRSSIIEQFQHTGK